MTITPVTPKHRERLVPLTTAVIIDFDATSPADVRANGVVIFDGVSGQNGWTALLITKPGGTRLVLDKLVAMNLLDVFMIRATAADSDVVEYVFQAGLRQITTTDDASVPRISEGGAPNAPVAVPLWSLPLDDDSGPPVDEQGNYVFSQAGAPAYQQVGVIPLGTAVALAGSPDALRTLTPDTFPPVTERVFTVTNLTAFPLTDVSVNVIVDTQTLIANLLMAADGGVKFLAPGDVNCAYWIEGTVNTTTTSYWFKVASLPVGTTLIRMRFSIGETFISFQDKNNTFLFFDDFDGPTPLAQWTTVQGTPTFAGGVLSLDAGDGMFANGFIVPDDTIVEASADPQSISRVGGAAVRIAQNTATGFVADGGANLVDILWWPGNLFAETNSGESAFGAYATGFKKYKFRYRPGFADSVLYDYNNGQLTASRTGSQSGILRPVLYASDGTCSWQWLRIYKDPANNFSVVAGPAADTVVGVGSVLAAANPDPLKSQRFSMVGWFNAASGGAQRALISCGRTATRGWVLRALATNNVEFRAFDGAASSAVTSSTVIVPGQWYQVAVVVDIVANVFRLYVNSTKEVDIDPSITQIVYEKTAGADTDDMFIGRDVADAPAYWQGLIDQWRYFANIVLTDGQVSTFFQQSTGPLRPPWVTYSRTPGDVYVRKDEPLTGEVLTVPGDVVDVGYNEIENEIEIFYIHNGKVFVVAGQAHDAPSTLTQPSVLKAAMVAGVIASGRVDTFSKIEFPPVKLAPPAEQLKTGAMGSGLADGITIPPLGLSPAPLNGSPAPVTVVIPSPFNSLVVSYELWKVGQGAMVYLATFPYTTELTTYIDNTFVAGEGYLARVIYRDPGSTSRLRTGPFAGVTYAPTGGDLFKTGIVASGRSDAFSKSEFPPLKLATPTDGPMTTGGLNTSNTFTTVRGWFAVTGVAASMSAAVGGHVVVTGLTSMGRQHLYLTLNVTGAANSANNGAWLIVEILSATSVRIFALPAPGADVNNGALSWSLSGPAPGFISINTQNIGVG